VSSSPARNHDLTTTFGRLVEVYSGFERQLGRSLEARCGIPHSWFEMMLRISRSPNGQITMSALAAQVALSTGGVTRIFDRMLAGGYAERVPCPTDRRVVYAALTPAGQAKLTEAVEVHQRNLEQLFKGLRASERRQLDQLLDRLRGATL
jgi:DNA-binding MarR family transcriptional regulator